VGGFSFGEQAGEQHGVPIGDLHNTFSVIPAADKREPLSCSFALKAAQQQAQQAQQAQQQREASRLQGNC